MTTELFKAAGLVWTARPQGGYAEAGKRFTIVRRGTDWCLTDRQGKRERVFGTLRDAKAGAEWVLARPKAK
jgi:hypothetical protein